MYRHDVSGTTTTGNYPAKTTSSSGATSVYDTYYVAQQIVYTKCYTMVTLLNCWQTFLVQTNTNEWEVLFDAIIKFNYQQQLQVQLGLQVGQYNDSKLCNEYVNQCCYGNN